MDTAHKPRTKASLHLVSPQASTAAEDLLAEGTMRVKAAVEFTGLGRTTLYGLMDRGELPWLPMGSCRLIPRKALVALLAGRLRGIPGA